jgi:hypothetical protein
MKGQDKKERQRHQARETRLVLEFALFLVMKEHYF